MLDIYLDIFAYKYIHGFNKKLTDIIHLDTAK